MKPVGKHDLPQYQSTLLTADLLPAAVAPIIANLCLAATRRSQRRERRRIYWRDWRWCNSADGRRADWWQVYCAIAERLHVPIYALTGATGIRRRRQQSRRKAQKNGQQEQSHNASPVTMLLRQKTDRSGLHPLGVKVGASRAPESGGAKD